MDGCGCTPCLENTRRNVIDNVMAWIADDSNEAKKVLWVYGFAGTGKSTLSTMIANNMDGLCCLGAFFFFNCDVPQRNFATLNRTLTYQLALLDTCFCAVISEVVGNYGNMAERLWNFSLKTCCQLMPWSLWNGLKDLSLWLLMLWTSSGSQDLNASSVKGLF